MKSPIFNNYPKKSLVMHAFLSIAVLSSFWSCAGMGGKECLDCLVTKVELDSGNLIKVQSFGSSVLSSSVSSGKLSQQEAAEAMQESSSPLVSALGRFRIEVDTKYATYNPDSDFDRSAYDTICSGSTTSSDASASINSCSKVMTTTMTSDVAKVYELVYKKMSESSDPDVRALAEKCFSATRTGSNDDCATLSESIIKNEALKKVVALATSSDKTLMTSVLAACSPNIGKLITVLSDSKNAGESAILSTVTEEVVKCDLNMIDNLCYAGQNSKSATEKSVKVGNVSQVLGCALYTIALPIRGCGLVGSDGKVVAGAKDTLKARFASGGTKLASCSLPAADVGGISDGDMTPDALAAEMQKSLVWLCGIKKGDDNVYTRIDTGEYGITTVCNAFLTSLNGSNSANAMYEVMGSLLK